MKLNFTNNKFIFRGLGLIALLFVGVNITTAQLVNTLVIDSPATISGDYQLVISQFGSQASGPITGSAVFIDDGTDPVTNGCEAGAANVSGKIAFIDRGDCEFGTKVLQAENAGAAGVIVCNNQETPAFAMTAGADGGNVNIFSGMISQADCALIRTEMAGGAEIDVSIEYVCDVPVYGDEVIWGRNSGEGDFSNGLEGWTVEKDVDTTTWEYTANGFPAINYNNDAFNGPINSATICNGAAIMNSDVLGGQILGNEVACANPCTSSLVSPMIDLAAAGADPNTGLFIQFSQKVTHFTSTYSIILSKNGGPFLDTIPLNAAVVTNTAVNNTLKIPLFGYEGVSNLQFKFEYVGNLYYWIIDDVAITNESYVDMQLNNNYYATAPAYKTPLSQASEIPFLVDMFNNGDQTAENLEVTMDITNASGSSVFNTVQSFDDLPGYSLNENMTFDETFTPTERGTYTATYSVSHDKEDQIADNNTISYTFEVTEDLFSNTPTETEALNETGQAFVSITSGSVFDNPFYAAGSAYYMPNGAGQTITSVRFGLDIDAMTTGFVEVFVYRVPVDDGFITGVGYDIKPSERELVGRAQVVVSPSDENFRIIDVPINDFNPSTSDPVVGTNIELEDNMNYLVLLSTRPFEETTQMGLLAYNTTSLDENIRNFYHNATNAALSSSLGRLSGTFFQETVNGTSDDILGVTFTDYDINTLFTEVSIDNISGTEDLNNDLAISTFPNPATDNLTVVLGLEKSSDIDIEITTVDGKTVMTRQYEDIKTQSVNFDISTIQSGIYFLNTRTDEGFKTQRIVIQN